MSFEYQEAGIEFLRNQPRAILGDDPGLGKSRQALLAAEGRTLIVAPSMVVDAGVWATELARWAPGLDATVTTYTRLVQRGAHNTIARKSDKAHAKLKLEYKGEWDTVIFDEAHYLKERKTSWTQAVRNGLHTDRLYLLTGTPVCNWAYELFVPIDLCNPGDDRFASYWRWIGEWFKVNIVKMPDGKGGKRETRQIGGLLECTKACDQIALPDYCDHWRRFQAENLGPKFLRRLRSDVLTDLPPLVEQTWELPLNAVQRKVYTALKKDYIAWTEAGNELTAWTESSLTQQVAKLTTGVELLDPDSPCSNKLDATRTWLDGRRGSVSIVFVHFRSTGAAVQGICDELGLSSVILNGETSKPQRRKIVADFQAGRYEVLVASIEAAKEGLTLTAADHGLFVERSWRPSSNEQVMRRIHRIGQDRPVSITHLVSKGTVDARMVKVLKEKTDQQVRALPATRIAAML